MAPPDLRLVESAPLPYLLSVPSADPPPSGAWPVLCFLHGYDEGHPTAARQGLTRHGPLSPGASPVATREFLVVAPQLPARGDLWGRYAGAVEHVVREVLAHHNGDPRRIYLTGFSFGGNGAFGLSIGGQGPWAALWPVDPTRVPVEDPGRPVWLSSGEVSRRREREFAERLGLKPMDPGTPGDRVVEDGGLDHVGTATAAYGDDRVYSWLISKRLPDSAT